MKTILVSTIEIRGEILRGNRYEKKKKKKNNGRRSDRSPLERVCRDTIHFVFEQWGHHLGLFSTTRSLRAGRIDKRTSYY